MRVCMCVCVCVCGVASVSLAVPACSCGAPPDTAELNQPLHEYTRMESCAQLTGEIGPRLALLPSSLALSCPPSGQTPAPASQCTGAGGSTQLGPEGAWAVGS